MSTIDILQKNIKIATNNRNTMSEPSSSRNKIEQFPFEHFEAKTAKLLMEKNSNKDLYAIAEEHRDFIRKLWEKISLEMRGTEVMLIVREEILKTLPPITQDIIAKIEYETTNWLFQEHDNKKIFIIKFMHEILQMPLIDIFEIAHLKNWKDSDLVQACLETNISKETIRETCLENGWSREEIKEAFGSHDVDIS